MSRNEVALFILLGGLVAAMASACLPMFFHIVNYRDMSTSGWLELWLWTAIVFFSLGVYVTALVVQRSSRQAAETEPAFLWLGATVGPLIGRLISGLPQFMQAQQPLTFWVTVVFSIALSFLGIRLACQFKRSRAHANVKSLLLRTLVPFVLTPTLIWLHYGSFPGVLALAADRQQWAYQEFYDYKKIVESVRTCQPIVTRVGSVIFVAPTFGENYVISDQGSSGHNGKLTLEVVGTTGVGVAIFEFHIVTHVGAGRFTYKNRTEKISCLS
ncbi:hypothetical protein NDA01_30595 [Trichocoleus desertorum AS-A10]|uniref:hypothetical protein n=1 Tax=Trichocoleus desertorum TaxID=1481672 RepID=UPI003296BA3F